MKRFVLLFVVAAAFLSCKTVPADIPDDLSQAELVQQAQEAADQENWNAALAYYQAILDRFPQDKSATVQAQYEMAFIEYKRGNTEAAEAGFQQVIAVYDFESEGLPQWPRVLSERILAEITAEREAQTSTESQ
jgi:outer membrane protein assembly factor BamD (BamD/ComL family)